MRAGRLARIPTPAFPGGAPAPSSVPAGRPASTAPPAESRPAPDAGSVDSATVGGVAAVCGFAGSTAVSVAVTVGVDGAEATLSSIGLPGVEWPVVGFAGDGVADEVPADAAPADAGPRNGNWERSSTAPPAVVAEASAPRRPSAGSPRPARPARSADASRGATAGSRRCPEVGPEPDASSEPRASATALRARAPSVIRVGGAESSCPGAPARPASESSAPAADRVSAGAAGTCGSEVGPVRSHGGTVTSGRKGVLSSSSDRGRSVTPSPSPPGPLPALARRVQPHPTTRRSVRILSVETPGRGSSSAA